MRTFIAVNLAPTPALRRLHERLAGLGDRFTPVALTNLHITLKFLGETAKEQVPEVCTALARAAAAESTARCRLLGLGAFPDARRPTVVWVGLDQGETLVRLAARLDRDLAPLGFAPEARAFQPHLTLLRVKSRPPEELFTLLADEAQTDFGIVELSKVSFFESELTPRGSRYTALANCALGPA
jgi:2'-5' RNA ligase